MADSNAEPGDFNKARRKRRIKNQAKKLLGVAAAIVVLLAVSATLAVYFKLDVQTSAENILASFRGGDGFPISTEHIDVLDILPLDGGVVVSSVSGVDVYNGNGALLGSFRSRYIRPVTKTGGGKVLTCDLGGTSVQVTSKTKELFTYQSEKGIQAGDICPTGIYAFSEIYKNYLSRVSVYNSLCEEMYVWSTNECYVTDIALAQNGRMMAVAGIDPGGGQLRSWIRFHDFMQTEESAAAPLDDQMVLSLCWNRNGELQVVTDRGVYIFDKNGKELHSAAYSAQPAAVENSAEGLIYLAMGDHRGQGGTVITAYDSNLQVLGTASVTSKLLSLGLSDGRLFILTEGRLLLADKALMELSDRNADDLFFVCPNGVYYYGVSTGGLVKNKL